MNKEYDFTNGIRGEFYRPNARLILPVYPGEEAIRRQMNPDQMRIPKIDAARRQLETALVLYFYAGDAVSLHTLVSAACGILSDLARARKAGPMLGESVCDLIKPERVAEFRRLVRNAQNFFKHADRDPDGSLAFNCAQSEFLLLDACLAYRRLTGERSPIFVAFEAWSAVTWARAFLTFPGMDCVDPAFLDRISRLGRQDFFKEILKVAHRWPPF